MNDDLDENVILMMEASVKNDLIIMENVAQVDEMETQ
jgi:hypothetical protein